MASVNEENCELLNSKDQQWKIHKEEKHKNRDREFLFSTYHTSE